MRNATSSMLAVVTVGAIALAGGWAVAQQAGTGAARADATPAPSEDRSTWVTRFFDLRHAEAESVAKVIAMFTGRTNLDMAARRVIWSGPPALAPAIEDAVRRLDVAPPAAPSLELTFHILRAGAAQGGGAPLPDDLEGVGRQVRTVFSVASVGLLETAMIRTSLGQGGRVEGRIKPWTPGVDQAEYTIRFGRLQMTDDAKGRSVRVPDLGFELPITGRSEGGKNPWSTRVKMDTSIDVREGQKAVVGKASVDRTDETILLVVTARLVE